MTKIIVNATDVLGEEIEDGMIRVSAQRVEYSYGSLVLPEFEDIELDSEGTAEVEVQPGRIVVQFFWDLNRTATVRVAVPAAGTYSLASLILQTYDRDPAVVSQVSQAVSDVESAYARTIQLEQSSRASAEQAEGSADEAREHRDAAKSHREAAAESETNSSASESVAAASAEYAGDSATSAAADRAAAQEARDKAQTAAINAAASEVNARDSASNIEDYEAAAEQHANRAQTLRNEMQGVIDSSVDVVRQEFAAYEAGAQAQADRAKREADRAATEVDTRVNELVDGAPEQFDTLRELADGIMANHDTVQVVINGLAGKSEKGHTHSGDEIEDFDAGKVTLNGSETSLRSALSDLFGNQTDLTDRLAEKADREHTHEIEDVTGLREELERAAGVGHTHSISEVDGLRQELDSKADSGHKHSWSEIEGRPSTYKPSTHKHISDDITDTSPTGDGSGGKIVRWSSAGKIETSSDPTTGNDLTRKGYVDREVGKKADEGHGHEIADVDGLDTALAGAGQTAEWGQVSGKPAAFPPEEHTHTPESLGAAPVDHTHSQYAEVSRVEALEGSAPIIASSLPDSPLPGRIYLVTE